MDAATERCQEAEPPVAQLVSEAFDDDPFVGRECTGRLALVVEIGEQVGRGALVEIVRLSQSGGRDFAPLLAAGQVGLELADECAHGLSELEWPPDRVAVPERELARDARCRADDDPLVGDLLDAPAARAEHDDVAVHPGAKLVDHLLVELPDAPAGRADLADHEHPEQPAVRDRPAARHGHDPGVAAALDDVGHAIPDDAWLELGEFVRRVSTGEHPEHALEDLAGERLVR